MRLETYVITVSRCFNRRSPTARLPLLPLSVLGALQVNCLYPRGRVRGLMRAPAKSYVTALAPLLARWLKRGRKEHGETCERSEDFSERQLLCLLCFFVDPVHAQTFVLCLKGFTSEGTSSAVWGFEFLVSSG